MYNWNYCSWGDISILEYGKSLTNYKNSSGYIPVYGTNGIIGWTDKPLYNLQSVIIGRKGAYRGVHYANSPFFVIDTAFYLRTIPGKEFDIKWAYYYLLHQDINSIDSGSAIPSTSREDFYALNVLVPPIKDQFKISEILTSFDDKIEANRRENETLEATARAIFKSWFVDFEPVHAKSRGEIPAGMDEETARLFPDAFVESELGLIPQGWEVGTLGESANISSGKRPNYKSNYWTVKTPIPIWGGGGVMGYTAKALIDIPILLTGRVGTLGKIFRISYSSWPSDNTIVILPNDIYMYYYIYFYLLDVDIIRLNRGSTQPLITQTDIKNINLIHPDINIIRAFYQYSSVLFHAMDLNHTEIDTLAETRDALLPKLMSGEVRVGDL